MMTLMSIPDFQPRLGSELPDVCRHVSQRYRIIGFHLISFRIFLSGDIQIECSKRRSHTGSGDMRSPVNFRSIPPIVMAP